MAALSGLILAALQHLDLAHHAVFQHGHIVEQVEGLEHHAHVAAVFRLRSRRRLTTFLP